MAYGDANTKFIGVTRNHNPAEIDSYTVDRTYADHEWPVTYDSPLDAINAAYRHAYHDGAVILYRDQHGAQKNVWASLPWDFVEKQVQGLVDIQRWQREVANKADINAGTGKTEYNGVHVVIRMAGGVDVCPESASQLVLLEVRHNASEDDAEHVADYFRIDGDEVTLVASHPLDGKGFDPKL